jgi:hypothetical protein
MQDCQTFIKLQEAVGSKQAKARNQGYAGAPGAVANNTPHPNHPLANLAITSPLVYTEYLHCSEQLIEFSREDHPITVPRPGNALLVLKAYPLSPRATLAPNLPGAAGSPSSPPTPPSHMKDTSSAVFTSAVVSPSLSPIAESPKSMPSPHPATTPLHPHTWSKSSIVCHKESKDGIVSWIAACIENA